MVIFPAWVRTRDTGNDEKGKRTSTFQSSYEVFMDYTEYSTVQVSQHLLKLELVLGRGDSIKVEQVALELYG